MIKMNKIFNLKTQYLPFSANQQKEFKSEKKYLHKRQCYRVCS